MAQYQVLYWGDVPLQVRARDEQGSVSQSLPPRFQEAVERAAEAAGATAGDAYVQQLRWGPVLARDGTAAEVVQLVLDELEDEFPTLDWRATAAFVQAGQEE